MKNNVIVLLIVLCSCAATRPATTRIDLAGKNLTAVPDSIFRFKKLEYLNLGADLVVFGSAFNAPENQNFLTVLPDQVCSLTRLKALLLSANNLTSLPKNFSNLQKLEYLDLSFNHRFNVKAEMEKIVKLPH